MKKALPALAAVFCALVCLVCVVVLYASNPKADEPEKPPALVPSIKVSEVPDSGLGIYRLQAGPREVIIFTREWAVLVPLSPPPRVPEAPVQEK